MARKKLGLKKLRGRIKEYLQQNKGQAFSARQLQKRLKVKNGKKDIQKATQALLQNNIISMDNNEKYQVQSNRRSSKENRTSSGNIFTGMVDKTRSGAAFIIVDELEKDIFIPPRRMGTALHGDEVKIRVLNLQKRRPTGDILQVTKRDRNLFVGKLFQEKNLCFVETEDGKTHFQVRIDKKEAKDIDNGTIVVVEVQKWPERKGKYPFGKISKVLGSAGSSNIEMNSILIKNGFNIQFPDEVQKEAAQISGEVLESEIKRRRDFRNIKTITIDPKTAKDFDDALSYRELENGDYEVGVHIADVTHFLKEDGPMDKEAKKRTTSVYLVDRVCPMLPEKLSNNLCSLVPHEDRYAFSAVFTFNPQHKIKERWFGKTVIHSDQRFTYEEAQEIIEGGEHELKSEILKLNTLATRLRKQRFQEGSISFETDEVKFELDDEGKPIEVYLKERKEAHLLVEDLMLLANREVATYIINKSKQVGNIPFVYRIHDEPDPDKIEDFAMMAREVGFDFDYSKPERIAASFNRLVEKAKHDDALKILEPIAVRTMAKAVYDTENIGHYGLGFDNYSHFTSPIRRYADVWVHRLLQKNLDGHTYKHDHSALKAHCKYISTVERKAQEAERESIRYKQAEFLQNKIGAILPGYISGVIEKGVFVELEGSLAEGLVPFSSLNEPFFVETRKYRATGERSGWVLKMGTRVRVKILKVDLSRREIDMALISMVDEE